MIFITGEQFEAELERAIQVPQVAGTYDVVFREGTQEIVLGSFVDMDVAARHRRAVIDAVLNTWQRAA